MTKKERKMVKALVVAAASAADYMERSVDSVTVKEGKALRKAVTAVKEEVPGCDAA